MSVSAFANCGRAVAHVRGGAPLRQFNDDRFWSNVGDGALRLSCVLFVECANF
jgi:hypothetical protein